MPRVFPSCTFVSLVVDAFSMGSDSASPEQDDLCFLLNQENEEPGTKNREIPMKTGIIGLPQVGKTSLFRMLTKVNLSEQAFSNPREAHIGVAKVPDERLDKLPALYPPKKLTPASVEYVAVCAL